MQRKRITRLNEYQSRRGPLGAGDVSADLACGRSPPGHQGAGTCTRAIARAPLWRMAEAPPHTGAWGLTRRSGAGMFFFAFQFM